MLRYRQSKANGVFFSVTKEEIFMLLSDKIKKFSVEQAIDYRNRNPVKNLPKLLDWADTFCAGKFEGQRRAISLEGDETTTDSRRSEKEVKRAQRKQKIVCKECKSTVSQSGDGAFPAFPRGDGQGTQSRTGKSVISAAGAAPRDSKTKKRAWKGPSMHVSGQMGFPRLGLAAGQLCWPWAG
jgi:hypothetical protein